MHLPGKKHREYIVTISISPDIVLVYTTACLVNTAEQQNKGQL